MTYLRRLKAAIILMTCLIMAQPAGAEELSNLAKLLDKKIYATALVVDLSNQKVLAALAPDIRLTPASTTKLYIDAAALKRWGPDHRFYTRLLTSGKIRNNTLKGDLILEGAGDPDLSHDELWTLISRLRQSGIREIEGNIVINDHLYGPVPCQIDDRCNARGGTTNAYDAPLSAAGINYSVIEITIIPAEKVGQPARIELLPQGLKGFEIAGEVKTSAAHIRPLYGVRRITVDGKDQLKVYGRVPLGKGPFHVYRSVADASRYTGQIFAKMLQDAGIKHSNKVVLSYTDPPRHFQDLAKVSSDALTQQLKGMMTYSNNYMADILTLNLSAYRYDKRPITLPDASQELEKFATRANNVTPRWLKGAETMGSPLTIESGSGLSVKNRLSARDLVSLLAYMYHQPDTFGSFVGTLPVPRYAPSRMLRRNGSTEWLNRVAAKTGYLSEPVSAIALAGYFRLKDGGWGAFAMIANGSSQKKHLSSRDSIGAFKKDMQPILEKY